MIYVKFFLCLEKLLRLGSISSRCKPSGRSGRSGCSGARLLLLFVKRHCVSASGPSFVKISLTSRVFPLMIPGEFRQLRGREFLRQQIEKQSPRCCSGLHGVWLSGPPLYFCYGQKFLQRSYKSSIRHHCAWAGVHCFLQSFVEFHKRCSQAMVTLSSTCFSALSSPEHIAGLLVRSFRAEGLELRQAQIFDLCQLFEQ